METQPPLSSPLPPLPLSKKKKLGSLVSFLNDQEAKAIGELAVECSDMLGDPKQVIQSLHSGCDEVIGMALARILGGEGGGEGIEGKEWKMSGVEQELVMAENRQLSRIILDLEEEVEKMIGCMKRKDQAFFELHTKLMTKLNPT